MLVQVVHCHPLIDSYNHALFFTIVTALEENGHEVVATDLLQADGGPLPSGASIGRLFSISGM
jgi:NAD(P)H dehydrogenase (quinone)